VADWFAENAPSQGGWFAKNAPPSDPGVPNPIKANPEKYTPAGLRPGDKPLPSTTVGAEALRHLPASLVRYASLGMTQPDTIGPQGIVNPITGIMDAASDVYHTFRHPLESFAQDPVATANAPAMVRGGVSGAREAVKASGAIPVAGTIARGAKEGIVAELPQIKQWGKYGGAVGALAGHGGLESIIGEGSAGAAAGSAIRAVPAAVRGAKGALARRAATKFKPNTEGYMPTIGQGAQPRPAPPPPPPSGPPRGPDWWEEYQQELKSQPPPQEPQYPETPEPTYIEPPAELPPPKAVEGPRYPEGWEPGTIPDYLKPGAETAEQMAARHEAEASAAHQPAAQGGPPTKTLDDIAMSLAGKKYARLDANGQATVQKIAAKENAPAPPAGLAAPRTPPPATQTQANVSRPLGGVSPADNETNLVNMLRGNTTRKNLEIGQYFTAKGMTPEQVAAMPEAQFNAHIRNVKNASGNPYQPSTGRNYHRTPEQARAEVVNAMRAMQPLPAPQMPTMIAAPPAPRGFFPPPTWPPQPPAQ